MDVTTEVRARRREKPQLSCHPCRKRKVRCDRIWPCSNCSSRGQGSLCPFPNPSVTAPPGPRRTIGIPHLQDHINQQHGKTVTDSTQQSPLTPATGPTPPSSSGSTLSVAETGTGHTSLSSSFSSSPCSSNAGSIRIKQSGASYVSSAHWTVVLANIAELRDFVEREIDEIESQAPGDDILATAVDLRLLYSGCPPGLTLSSVLKCLPPRPIVDRLVSRFLTSSKWAPHRGKFLREYEEFWSDPPAALIVWVGLLYTVMSLSTKYQLCLFDTNGAFSPARHRPDTLQQQTREFQNTIELYLEKAVQCLFLGRYTEGGPYVVESLTLYFIVEVFLCTDINVGLYTLVGVLVQLAISDGYHRDAKHFPSISRFEAEMRRRTWALILQIDSNISSHLGLPRRVLESQFDTAEPRSLHDTDFDDSTTELPPPRPETEVIAALYTRTKLRLISIGNRVTDLLTPPSPYTYADARNLIRQLDAVHDAFPASLKWQGFASSIAVPSQLTIQRIWLEMCVLRGKLALMSKFLLAPRRQTWRICAIALVCIDAATKTLEFQHFLDEETWVDGLLYQSRWNITATFMNDFLLVASILCFNLQITPPHGEEQQHQQPRDGPGSDSRETGTDSGHDTAETFKDNERIRKLLRMSHPNLTLTLSSQGCRHPAGVVWG
ncbi:Pyrrolocin cluster transcription factor fsdR [Corynascus novoguineensis]|uniref:Pyrrolocin cluster transcription factor fsdR n=1 Tax=Corynascus novoguineensis TaxID=1126955 RepID=A0AAN7CK23_9PEZI|nr:Pyrrolocin cluster transcription factor fsdR [Corynascus novoguineensis]